MNQANSGLVPLDWPAPPSVHACFSLRYGGVSAPPYQGFNVADHVGDDPASVANNRRTLKALIGRESILWLNQVHGTRCLSSEQWFPGVQADGVWTKESKQVCCVMTADCLPLFLCDQGGRRVAVIHCGWRGLQAGIIDQAIACFKGDKSTLLAYLGPSIGPLSFEVGAKVRSLFIDQYGAGIGAHFIPSNEAYLANLYGIATFHLHSLGIKAIYGGEYCTYLEQERFFSYRRDGQTGRMANLIWIE